MLNHLCVRIALWFDVPVPFLIEQANRRTDQVNEKKIWNIRIEFRLVALEFVRRILWKHIAHALPEVNLTYVWLKMENQINRFAASPDYLYTNTNSFSSMSIANAAIDVTLSYFIREFIIQGDYICKYPNTKRITFHAKATQCGITFQMHCSEHTAMMMMMMISIVAVRRSSSSGSAYIRHDLLCLKID